ncbi:MAG TPA: zinc ribbon domain-containing protein [Ktedonobacteraceae bacterium]|nr:zinc ribbon domain-containing protein [Ktedonobacteraceae bacterium]
MADFVESAKNFVNSAVSRTSWEAQKQLRLRGKQSEVDKLMDQRQQLMNDLGLAAMNLYTQGKITDTQLSRLCASVLELDHDVKKRETQLQEIKSEVYSADQFAAANPVDYTPPPTTPPSPPPTAPGVPPQPSPTPQAQGSGLCPHCHNPLRPNALYCRSCGAKVR